MGTVAALGTMHGKAAAIGPPLSRIGIGLVVPPGLDTDRFGTFSGEIARTGSMLDAVRAKARAAAALAGLRHGMASEGSYGPHPQVPFLALGQEILLWRDEATGQEVVETILDHAPLHDHAEVASPQEAGRFLRRVGFPTVAVIVAPGSARNTPTAKGLRDGAALDRAIRQSIAASSNGTAFLQTDMRAHLNPRRMEIIARLAARLADRLATPCPACDAPGFGLLHPIPGLPCADCGTASILAAGERHGCTACGHAIDLPRPDRQTAADPAACPVCNP